MKRGSGIRAFLTRVIAFAALASSANLAPRTAEPAAAAPGSPGLASEPVFAASGLTAGTHTLVITVTGTTNSDGAHVIVDAFDVTP